MKLIKPYYEILEQSSGIEGMFKQIEIAGRTCYKSEDKITEDSAKKFVYNMIKSGHLAMLEHGTVYMMVKHNYIEHVDMGDPYDLSLTFVLNKFSRCNHVDSITYITTNLRVIFEQFPEDWEDILKKYACDRTEHHPHRVSVRFVCDRGISHEFVRHRVFSFAQESIRYCNYSKDNFDNEIIFIKPCWCDDIPDDLHLKDSMDIKKFVWGVNNLANTVIEKKIIKRRVSKFTQRFLYRMAEDENTYIGLISAGYKPQEARTVLPNALKTELVMTGFTEDWKHFFDLRAIGTTGTPHPQAKELAEPLMNEFKSKNYIK